jgi:hypothetical protein
MRTTTYAQADIGIEAELERLEKLAALLDTSFKIPYTDFRVGLDAIVGLIPGVGDVSMSFISFWIVARAWRLGAGPGTILHMCWNIGVDAFIGLFPLVGDVLDVGWKANSRNVRLLRETLEAKGMIGKTIDMQA